MHDELIVGLFDAKTRLSELVETCAAGRDIVITKRGEPIVRIVPYGQPGHGRPETLAGLRAVRERASAGPSIPELRDEGRAG